MNKFVPGVILLSILLVAGFVLSQGNKVKQPIRYSHKIHIEQAEMSCTDCHQYAEEKMKAGIPSLEVCASCHEEPMTESQEEQKLIGFINSGKEIPWHQVTTMRPDVYFSHRRHVQLGDIECQKCHGQMEKLDSPPEKPAINLSMDFCMDCHEQSEAVNDCLLCHR